MSLVTTLDESEQHPQEKPGAILASIRQEKGFSTDYVASKLHLRVQVIEHLEQDEYTNMPEPVFIKGYLRAYAKLLSVPHEPLLETFSNIYAIEKKPEKTLWQSRRETNRAEYIVKVVTALFALSVLTAVTAWWYKNKEQEQLFTNNVSTHHSQEKNISTESDIRLTDLSNMHNILSAKGNYSALEIQHD